MELAKSVHVCNGVHMPEKTCPYCREPFVAVTEETESCRKAACVKANQRAKKRLAAGVTEVKRGRPRKTPGTALDAAHAAGGAPLDPADSRLAEAARGSMKDRGAPGYTKPIVGLSGMVEQLQPTGTRILKALAKEKSVGDVNALARNVILSRVKTKMPQEDSIEDRLKRLEQAMKQFASKKKAQPKGGEA